MASLSSGRTSLARRATAALSRLPLKSEAKVRAALARSPPPPPAILAGTHRSLPNRRATTPPQALESRRELLVGLLLHPTAGAAAAATAEVLAMPGPTTPMEVPLS